MAQGSTATSINSCGIYLRRMRVTSMQPIFTSRQFRVSADTPWLEVCRSDWDTRRPWRRILWEQTRLAALARGLDLLHGLAFAAPLVASCPTIVTVHDLSFLRFPAAFRPFNRWYLSWITRTSTRRAARVIAVSESTREDVIALCGIPPERVVTIPNGVTEEFSPADPARLRRLFAGSEVCLRTTSCFLGHSSRARTWSA